MADVVRVVAADDPVRPLFTQTCTNPLNVGKNERFTSTSTNQRI